MCWESVVSHLYLGNVWPRHVNVVEGVLAVGSFGTSRMHVARSCRVVIFFFNYKVTHVRQGLLALAWVSYAVGMCLRIRESVSASATHYRCCLGTLLP